MKPLSQVRDAIFNGDNRRPAGASPDVDSNYTYTSVNFDADFADQPPQLPPDLQSRYPGKDLPDATKWRYELMRGNNGAQHNNSYEGQPKRQGKRWHAWYDRADRNYDETLVSGVFDASRVDYFLAKTYVDTQNGYLVQKGLIDPDGGREGGQQELHASWLDTYAFDYFSDVQGLRPVKSNELVLDREASDDPSYLLRSPNRTFGQNTYFEIAVNFEEQYSPGHRHSFWLMPALDADGNVAKDAPYNSNETDGVEIDIYEHEHTGPEGSEPSTKVLLMKALGGEESEGGVGDTMNEIAVPSDGEGSPTSDPINERSWELGTISVDGINSGWHAIGLLWTNDANGSRLRWFVDGLEVVKDSRLAPENIQMYLLLTREITSNALNGFDALEYQEQIDDSKVKIRYVRAWDVELNQEGGSGTKPPAPSGVTATSVGSSIELRWDSVAQAEKYNVYRDGNYVTTVTASTSFSDTDVSEGVEYAYTVVSVDEDLSGDERFSVQSRAVTIVAGSSGSSRNPPAPSNVSATADGGGIRVNWSGVSAAEKYNVYRDGSYIATVTGTTRFNDSGVSRGVSYTYEIVSVDEDQSGDERFSVRSNPASATA